MGKAIKVCFVLTGAALGLGAGAMPEACATCIHGSQCSVRNGTTENRSDEHFTSVGPFNNSATSALVVTDGSTLNGERLTVNAGIDAKTGHAGQAAHVDKGGRLKLIDTIITSDGFGVNLGKDSRFTMIGGTIRTRNKALSMAGTNNHATLTGVDIASEGGYSIWHDGYYTDSTLTLDGGTTLHHVGSAQAALYVGGGLVSLDDAHITVTSTQAGVQGIVAMGRAAGLARVQANNFSIQASGDFILGMQLDRHSDALLKNGSITTNGNKAWGIWLAGGTLSTDNLSITTSGDGAHAIMSSDGTTTLNNSHLAVSGNNAWGISSDSSNPGFHSTVTMNGGSIATSGYNGRGVVAAAGGQAHLDGVTITTAHNVSHGMQVYWDAAGSFNNGVMTLQGHGVRVDDSSRIDINHSVITGASADRYGLMVGSQSEASLTNGSVIDMGGANSRGLAFVGATAANALTVDASKVFATGAGAFAVAANGGTDTLDIKNGSTLSGDSLAFAGNHVQSGVTYGSRLTLNADRSQLSGHAVVTELSTLTMNLGAGSRWTLAPSAGGRLQSNVSFLDLDGGNVVFAPNQSYQTLIIGSGELGGRTDVYRAQNGASIILGVRLNEGGALGSQHTDRLLINGDVTGTTLIHINAATGSEGGLTGNTASDGISIIQASGSAPENAFALPGGYVTLNGQPWRYGLHAYGPGSTNGVADNSQRLVDGTNPHWDWRLQSERLGQSGSLKPVPQIANYLLAPTALFQAGLLDVATLHRRLGDARQMGTRPTDARSHREFFLRTYGGEYDYRSNRPRNAYGYAADIRYTATQIGGTVHAGQSAHSSARIGLVANYGQLRFAPRDEPDTRKTRMDTWSVSPTLSWQADASGAYVDTVLAVGKFHADVTTKLRSKTTTLNGTRQTASVETGLPLIVGTVTATPQAQVVYQRLHFDRVRDVDGFDVSLGSPKQWTFKAGMEVRTTRFTVAGSAIRLYGKMHFAQNLNRHRQVWLGEAFALGKSGTVLENGAGVDAVLAKGRATLFADLIRQHRFSRRAGNQGWSTNMGVKVKF